MNAYEEEVKTVYEELAGRALTEAEVANIILSLRQFAAFLIECGRDEDLRAKIGLPPSADPRVVNNTSQTDGEPHREPVPARADPPTAPLRGTKYRDSSAVTDAPLPAPTAPTPAPSVAATTCQQSS